MQALHKKWNFPVRISSVMWSNQQETACLVTFTEEILKGKLHFCEVKFLMVMMQMVEAYPGPRKNLRLRAF